LKLSSYSKIIEIACKGDSVVYLTLFLAAVFGFESWPFQLSVQLAFLAVLLLPSLAQRPGLWFLLATAASIVLVRDIADNHKYLLCYWLWVMCVAHLPNDTALSSG